MNIADNKGESQSTNLAVHGKICCLRWKVIIIKMPLRGNLGYKGKQDIITLSTRYIKSELFLVNVLKGYVKCSKEQPLYYAGCTVAVSYNKKSGNWGLDEIDCHRSHKGQCTSRKCFSFQNLKKKFVKKRIFWKQNFGKKI